MGNRQGTTCDSSRLLIVALARDSYDPAVMEPVSNDITLLLVRLKEDGKAAYDRLLPLVYDELRRIADARLRSERDDHTLQATALVHEAYLKLVDQVQASYESRVQFLRVSSTVMRRILIDHARARNRDKRGKHAQQVPLSDHVLEEGTAGVDLLALDEALQSLQAFDPRKVQIVEMRFFAGMTVPETADALGLSPATVKRDWEVARLWLTRDMAGDAADDS